MSADNIKMTLIFGDKSVETDLKTIKQINRDLKSGKIQYVSNCHHAGHKFIEGKFICLQCGETCKLIPIREAP